MPYGNKIKTSLHGRRLGLQIMSSSESGGSAGNQEYLVGPQALRLGVTTAETTATRVSPYGVSGLSATSAGSSSVFTLSPPVPGVTKLVAFHSAGVYLKTANAETFVSTVGSSATTLLSSGAGGVAALMGYTTAIWLLMGNLPSGFALSTTT